MRGVLLALILVLLPSLAAAQENRAILWVVEVDEGATVDRDALSESLREVLSTADDADHIVDAPGLADYIRRHGLPIPGCLTGLSPCEDPAGAIADALRIDVVATVTAFGTGHRMTLTVRGVGGGPSRTLSFEGDTIRGTLFMVVTDFVGAAGELAVTSRPTGATVALDGLPVGETPYQAELSVGIYTLEIMLEGYRTWEETVEIRPNQTRLVDRDLTRSFAEVYVESITPNAVVRIDDQEPVAANSSVRVSPGDHVLSIEAPDYSAEVRRVTLSPGEDRRFRVDLEESPAAIRARQMGYIYERPFYIRGGLRFAGTRSGFGEASGSVGGTSLTVECPRSTDGDCEPTGLPTNWVGLGGELGYSFEVFELSLVGFSYSISQIGGSSGGGRTLTLLDGQGVEDTGRLDTVSRFQIDPLHVGARLLFNQNWSAFARGGVGWYTEMFEVENALGDRGDFDRQGWNWSAELGIRYYLNDTIFISGSFFLGDDITYDDVDLTKGFDVSLGITWEDVIGISDWFGDDDPPEEL